MQLSQENYVGAKKIFVYIYIYIYCCWYYLVTSHANHHAFSVRAVKLLNSLVSALPD